MTEGKASTRKVIAASLQREWVSHRLNRFLYWHLLLLLGAGSLALFAPSEAAEQGGPWWILYAVLYAVSLSALLLGLSSAHAEAEEFPLLLTQPVGIRAWLAGKSLGMFVVVGPSAVLLALPSVIAGHGNGVLWGCVAAAAGVSAVCAFIGLAIGLWIRDGVRGIIAVLAAWLLLLFGTDLLLLAIAGAPWVQSNPDWWVAPLMTNPLDAFRITILFGLEKATFASLDQGRLVGWWLEHTALWFTFLTLSWLAMAGLAASRGAARRTDN
jgi:ABC-2 type transport system permease protein/Cu-processing system permease protein